MPRDFPTIDAQTYGESLARLEAELATAQDEFDVLAVKAATDDAFRPGREAAHTALQQIDGSIAALKRARELSIAAEVRAEEERRAAETREEALAIIAEGEALTATARKMDEALERLIDLSADFSERWTGLHSRVVGIIAGHPRERVVLDALSHRLEGVVMLGLLRAADIPNLDMMEPIDAMHQAKGKTIAGLVSERIERAFNLASTDVPDFKQDKE